MYEEIKSIIEKNLPAQVGESLKKVLEQGKKDAESVKSLNDQIQKLVLNVNEKEKRISEYQKFDDRNAKLDERESQLAERERNMTITQLRMELVAEKEKSDFAKSVAMGLVRNAEYRRSLWESKDSPTSMDQYGVQRYANSTYNSDEKATQE